MAECETLRQAIIMAVKMNFLRVCFESNSLIVINVVNGKLVVLKKIINIVKDIRLLLLGIREDMVQYCSRNSSRETDALTKKAIM